MRHVSCPRSTPGVGFLVVRQGLLLALVSCAPAHRASVGSPFDGPTGADVRREVVVYGAFRIEQMNLAARIAGDTMWLSALATNTSDAPASLGLELRSAAGQWSPSGSERTYSFSLAPHERRFIEGSYRLRIFTTEAALRVGFGQPVPQPGQPPKVEELFFVRWYPLTGAHRGVTDLRDGMTQLQTDRLTLFAVRGSKAERDLPKIAAEREAAITSIAELVGADFRGRIRMVFYPDSATKVRATGHMGMGLAFDRNIVEIYSETQHLDPFHELTHIVAQGVGSPPALFDEGLAVYVTERLGGDALEYLGYPGSKIRTAVCGLAREKQLIPLDSLLHFTDIGSEESRAAVSYPESASIVQFLVERRGAEQFREIYRRLTSSADPAQWRANASVLTQVTGVSVADLEREWMTSLDCGR